MNRPTPFAGLGDDLRRAARLLTAAPWFTAVAALTIGLGIGANTTIFSVVNAVLLERLPYREPERLVVILQRGASPVSPANLTEWRAEARSFETLGAAELWSATLTGGGEPERLTALRITPDLFALLGVGPALGRLFGPTDDGDGGPVVLSHQLWRRRFGGDSTIVGRTVIVNGAARVVAGVMGPSFQFPPFWATGAELWAPLPLAARANSRSESLRVFGRLAPGVSLARARSEMATITARLERQLPGSNRNIEVTALTDRVVGSVRPALWLLTGAVGMVLLIACANVAQLLMARAEARRREMAVRAALGASRLRLGQQLALESGLLALLGGALGLALAWLGVRAIPILGPLGIPRLAEVAIDPAVLGFTVALAILTGVIFGIAPALAGSRVDLAAALTAGGSRGATGGTRNARWRDGLVATQFAVAVVLLIGAGLLLRSFAARVAVDPGFDPEGVTTLVVSVAGTQAGEPSRRGAFYRDLIDRIERLPGVEAAGTINHLPLAGDFWNQSYHAEGQPLPAPGMEPRGGYRVVMPGYFRVVRLPLLAGRDFSRDDDADAPGVIIVNEALARLVWPGQDPIGRRISLGDPTAPTWLLVIGVAGNAVRSDWTAAPGPEFYRPLAQSPAYLENPNPAFAYQTVVIRSSASPEATAAAVRSLLRELDRDVPVSAVQTLGRVVAGANAEPRFYLVLLATFAALALALAAIGSYGVLSYAVAQRTREIGIRMTLGADRRRVVGLVVGRGLAVAGAGAGVGVLGALGLTRFMTGMLYGVGSIDPLTFGVVPLLLGMTAVVAAGVPAIRAARIDPATAVRAGDPGG